MSAIFISYRRDDTEGQAGRLFDELAGHFGPGAVFMDVAAITPGRDFRRAIDEHVADCGVLLAVIGRQWLTLRDEAGGRRIDDPLDFVRLEVAAALRRDIPVVPVLVQGARMPRAAELPEDLQPLVYRNALALSHAMWESDVQVLVRALRQLLRPVSGAESADATTPPLTTPPRPRPPRWPWLVGSSAVAGLALGGGLLWGTGTSRPVDPLRTLDAAPPAAGPADPPAVSAPAASPAAAAPSPAAKPPPAASVRWRVAEFPPPNAGLLAYTFTRNGDPACASYDARSCLWGVPLRELDLARVQPLVCGEAHRRLYGETGYEDPRHWCVLAQRERTGRPPR